MATTTVPVFVAVCIAVGLSTAEAQQTRAFTPQEQAIWDAMTPSLEAAQRSANELYRIEVQNYGRHAVLECRSRALPRVAYGYCLEANKGH